MAVQIASFSFRPSVEDGLHQLGEFNRRFPDHPNLLVLIFANAPADALQPILPWFEALWPQATVVGAQCGPILNSGPLIDGEVLVQCLRFERTTLRSQVLPWQADLETLGERLYRPLVTQDTRLALTFFNDSAADCDALFDWVNAHHPDITIAGGRMTDQVSGWVFANGLVQPNHCLVVTFDNPELKLQSHAFSQWHQIGRSWTVTRAQGTKLYELDGRPVQALYDTYLNDSQPLNSADYRHFPLMHIDGSHQRLCIPIDNLSGGGFQLSEPLAEGDRVRFAYSHPSISRESLSKGALQLSDQRPELLLAFNCQARATSDSGGPDLELTPLRQLAPLGGAYCAGELHHENGKTQLLQHHLTVLALAEDPAEQRPLLTYQSHALTPLFHLIQESVKDLDQVNRDLEAEVKHKTRELFRKYETDAITGLANRVGLLKCLRDADPWPIVQVCSLKVNNLRQINNLYGYAIGDQLLGDLSQAIQNHLPELLPTTALVFRGSPNEFLIVAPAACSNQAFFRGMAQLTERLQDQSDVFSAERVRNVLPILLTAGTAHRDELPPNMKPGPEDLLIKASEARRHAYHHQLPIARALDMPGNDQHKRDGLIWLGRVRTALANDEVEPFIQPLFNAQGDVPHVEALIRIRQDGRIYAPKDFLDLVKPTQLYPRLSMRMIDETFRLLKDLNVGFTLNFTARDLGNTELIERLKTWLRSGIAAERVTLEIVESDGLRDFQRFAITIMELRRLGCQLAIDDFGSAYSNLERVLHLKPDWIKLDGSLIRNLDESEVSRILVRRVVQLCQDLNIRTVAEHVHSNEILDVVKVMGVDYFQGFHLAEPMAVADFCANRPQRQEMFA
ncbi:EAL domain-containing protein [Saccharospirillum mangrovi]|uniref:bifunctional diguanylate cyclase/phosphodiesterase n=1 Tax=Saccharospirillum mangrovi TaxID=2161747 RepID=UPI000D3321CF|nr:EAL domain-containing protein [Saccharospirillum mangrovi]